MYAGRAIIRFQWSRDYCVSVRIDYANTMMRCFCLAGLRAREANRRRRTVLAGLIGNVMEWFDFAVYGYFASVIGAQFFPQSSAGYTATADIRGVRGRIPGPAHRQPGARCGRGSHRPPRAAGAVDRADGWRDVAHRTAADLCVDRRRRSHPAGHAAAVAGLLGGRRVHRIDGVHHRVRARRRDAASSAARPPWAPRSDSSSARAAPG